MNATSNDEVLLYYWRGTKEEFMRLSDPPQMFPDDIGEVVLKVVRIGKKYISTVSSEAK